MWRGRADDVKLARGKHGHHGAVAVGGADGGSAESLKVGRDVGEVALVQREDVHAGVHARGAVVVADGEVRHGGVFNAGGAKQAYEPPRRQQRGDDGVRPGHVEAAAGLHRARGGGAQLSKLHARAVEAAEKGPPQPLGHVLGVDGRTERCGADNVGVVEHPRFRLGARGGVHGGRQRRF